MGKHIAHGGHCPTSSGLDRDISACCWCLMRHTVLKVLILINTAVFVSIIIGYYFVGTGSDSQRPPNNRLRHQLPLNASRMLHLWSSDFHISPIADIKDLLSDSAIVFDRSLSGHCHLTNTCERDLRVITKMNGIELSPCPNQLRRQFYTSYRDDPVMRSVDAFVCTHAASMCELFMPFQRPLIVIASTRYEIGRHDTLSWMRWNENLVRIAASPHNTVAANNRYDQEYIRYFTGLHDVVLLPNICGYVKDRYDPTRPEVLLAPARGIDHHMQSEMTQSLRSFNSQVTDLNRIAITPIRDLYEHFEYRDLSAHPAIVLLPYQVSFMSLFEFYRMQIPMFVPSPKMLTRWHLKHQVLNERCWSTVFGEPSRRSALGRHPHYDNSSSMMMMMGDPNDEFNESSILSWVSLADFYQWPHITTFDSWYDLFSQLHTLLFEGGGGSDRYSGLRNISASMGVFAQQQEATTRQSWRDIVDRVWRHPIHVLPHNASSLLPATVDQALSETYGYTLSTTDCSAQIPVTGRGH